MRSVERHRHEKTGDQTGERKSQNPTAKNPPELAPVDGTNIIIHQRHSDSRTRETLGGTDRKAKSRREKDGDRSTEFHGETSSGRHLSEAVT